MVILVYYEDGSPKLLLIIHIILCMLCITPVRVFHVGFLWGFPGVFWRSSSCCSFLWNCSTSWRASQLCYPCNCNAVEFGSSRIWQQLLSAGVNQKGLLLLLLWSEMWKWNGKCLLMQLLQGRPTAGPCLPWAQFVSMVPLLPGGHFSVKIAQQSCSGRTLWISLLTHIFSKCWFSSSCGVPVVLF